MKVSGSQTLTEGTINEILVTSGSTRINGNLECQEFKSSGLVKGSGSLSVRGDFQCSGTFKLAGSLNVEGDARSSGTTIIDGEMIIKGEYKKSGTLRTGKQVDVLEGIKVSGLTNIKGNLLTEKYVTLRGNTTIDGNIKADSIFIGSTKDFRPIKHPYKVRGNLVAEDEVDIIKTYVSGDVMGRHVRIGRGTEVKGTVYYIDTIEVNPKAILEKKPIQIKDE